MSYRYSIGLLISLLVVWQSASAQWSDSNGFPVTDINPQIIYNASTGVTSLKNVGDNGVVDSLDNSTRMGDDTGFIGLYLTLNSEMIDPQPLLPLLENGIAWAAPVNFIADVQLFGNALASSFLPIDASPTPLFELPPGLVAADFVGDSGLIEMQMGVNDTFGAPGRTLFSDGDPIASGAFVITIDTGAGDFDGDLDYDCDDADSLVFAIATGSGDMLFDLNTDGAVDTDDLDAWRAEAGAFNNSNGGAYLPADANLDGVVDGSDFNLWNGNKFTSTPAWCSADFNADGVVDGSDFNVWNANKFLSSDSVTVVPEPQPLLLLPLGAFLLIRRK